LDHQTLKQAEDLQQSRLVLSRLKSRRVRETRIGLSWALSTQEMDAEFAEIGASSERSGTVGTIVRDFSIAPATVGHT
jgi:hypothetical protein